MDPKRHGYLAYLLRLWRVEDGAEAVWHASLQDVRSGERRGFAGLTEAVRYLEQQMDGLARDLRDREPSLPSEPGANGERR